MRAVGYVFLAGLEGVTALPPARRSVVGPVTSVVAPPNGDRLVPAGVAPAGGDLLEHILFALKHEGVDLQILAQTLPRVRREQLERAITETPGGIYLRKACHLWELFTGRQVTERPRVTGARAPLFDPKHYVVGPSRYDVRWRVDFNGLGTPRYCATVERTPAIEQGLADGILSRARDLLGNVSGDLLERAMTWAYLSETRYSFAIENETPPADKTEAFVALLRKAHEGRDLSEDYLVDLHRATIINPFLAEFSFRTEQNWLADGSRPGTTSVTYIPPPSELARELMNELMAFANGGSGPVDPIVMASVLSFGFVYLHPFMDGNGRLSRFLYHHTLCRSGQLPAGAVLPVSAAIVKHLPRYLEALKAYSRPMRDRWQVEVMDPERPRFTFDGDASLYRYWDATAAVEFGFEMARTALETTLVEEVAWLQRYDRIAEAVNARYDVRNADLAVLVRSCLEDEGNRISKNRRRQYADRVPSEVFDFIEACARGEFDVASSAF